MTLFPVNRDNQKLWSNRPICGLAQKIKEVHVFQEVPKELSPNTGEKGPMTRLKDVTGVRKLFEVALNTRPKITTTVRRVPPTATCFAMMRTNARVWRPRVNPNLEPSAHSARMVVDKTTRELNTPPSSDPMSGQEKGCVTVEFTMTGTNQKCQCHLRDEPNSITWPQLKSRHHPELAGRQDYLTKFL